MDRSFIPIGPRHSLYVLHLNPATSTKIKTGLPVLQMTANINSPMIIWKKNLTINSRWFHTSIWNQYRSLKNNTISSGQVQNVLWIKDIFRAEDHTGTQTDMEAGARCVPWFRFKNGNQIPMTLPKQIKVLSIHILRLKWSKVLQKMLITEWHSIIVKSWSS